MHEFMLAIALAAPLVDLHFGIDASKELAWRSNAYESASDLNTYLGRGKARRQRPELNAQIRD